MNIFKQKLKSRSLSFGCWITFPCEASAEILARTGFEWLVLDMEHAPLGVEEAARLIRIIDLAGLPAICRLPSNDSNLAKNVLDAGAAGIMVPTIESAEQARKAVDAAYYPPRGKRGVGLGRAQAYGAGFKEYCERSDKELIVIAMIETKAGAENAEAIAGTPGIDGVLVGPYDLSGSLGPIGELHHPDLDEAKKKVQNAARQRKIGYGLHVVHPTEEAIQKALREDHTFLALGVDMIFLDQAAKSTLAFAKKTALEK
ncbi:MAG: 2,4-dihydroxyhept-2-ene-1,7-dioic acid aldolase [Deltaproteobacteria bacterium]|nr:2,4-dihydroxyhept-2-ene-1,7-dioic acid aldolase [Deltaproteobacteria bacterium]